MKVLMFGWEFPPYSSGGLGTACYGLTKSLSKRGIDITFVLPRAGVDHDPGFLKLISAGTWSKVKFRHINTVLRPYLSSTTYGERVRQVFSDGRSGKGNAIYGPNLFDEVHRYTLQAEALSLLEDFDLIHAHDWMTFQAGARAKAATGRPLVVHVHATEFDRTGGNPDQRVYDIERAGMHAADRVIAVSNFTRQKIIDHYGVDPAKVRVVHNEVDFPKQSYAPVSQAFPDEKVVLFLGRLTLQKGPDYFLYAAKRVLDKVQNVKFVVAGSGDMEAFMIEKAAHMGIADKFLFTGFLNGPDIDRAYRMADLYVMPSVSEPFGITPLEALRNNTPVIISKQSGVSEVLKNALKVDFWDIEELADKIVASLSYPSLHAELREEGLHEVHTFTWDRAADKCHRVYDEVLRS